MKYPLNKNLFQYSDYDGKNIITGTYIYNKTDSGTGAYAMRAGFLQDGTSEYKILEAGAEINDGNPNEETKPNGWETAQANNIKQHSNGSFYTGTNVNEGLAKTANIFNLNNNTSTKITMRIWLDGADRECVNAIKGQDVGINIQFGSDDL